ncbi:MAG TPA: acyltransferase [Ideonella sp.]|uniref:acyltransferase family protein n=1 Tax=Ideonella sp. TaxID=1929293 RepID=UPI002BEAD928|nr:acyltransferase [Ideonella sp.]HSI52232.1 acyltransferase [Ideonella sp.]
MPRVTAPPAPAAARQGLPLITLGKAIASQLIVWHHLAIYSPMRAVVDPLAPELFAWLANPARMAVQVFLVMAGFLAARSLLPSPGAPANLGLGELPGKLRQRYRRLVPPCLVAMLLAILSAALARTFSDDPQLPGMPTPTQLLANLLLLQDIVGEEALSAGLWYVAIDLQLFAMLLAVLGLRRCMPARWRAALTLLCVAGLAALSWLLLNRDPNWDAWAPYFFGAYGAGLLAAWVRQARAGWARRAAWLALGALVALSLALAWRDRVLLAGLCALALALPLEGHGAGAWLRALPGRLARLPAVDWLARVSYSVFLAHYPVCLLIGALVAWAWPEALLLNSLGLIAAWSLSLLVGWLLHLKVELPAQSSGGSRAAPAPNKPSWAGARAAR